jgi:hypothetical protein
VHCVDFAQKFLHRQGHRRFFMLPGQP